jgi:hypothetical protein
MAEKVKKEAERSAKFAEGGHGNHMFGPQGANEQEPGVTEHDATPTGAGPKYAEGGKGKMFGFAPSEPAKAGITSAR